MITEVARRRRRSLSSRKQSYDARPGDVFGIPFQGRHYHAEPFD